MPGRPSFWGAVDTVVNRGLRDQSQAQGTRAEGPRTWSLAGLSRGGQTLARRWPNAGQCWPNRCTECVRLVVFHYRQDERLKLSVQDRGGEACRVGRYERFQRAAQGPLFLTVIMTVRMYHSTTVLW